MDKVTFLVELQGCLQGHLPEDELKDILKDYNEYFETGLQDGKTEEELGIEFGSPEMIAKELLAEKFPLEKKESLQNRAGWLKIAVFLLLGACFLLGFPFRINYSAWFLDGIVTVLFPSLLIGMGFSLSGRTHLTLTKPTRIMRVVLVGLMAITVCMVAFLIWVAFDFERLLRVSDLSAGINFSLYVLFFIFWIMALAILWVGKQRVEWTGWFFALFGALMTAFELRYMFGSISTAEQLQQASIRSLYPFVLGILLSIGSTFWLAKKYRTNQEALAWTAK